MLDYFSIYNGLHEFTTRGSKTDGSIILSFRHETFLCRGITLATFQLFGTETLLNECVKTVDRGPASSKANCLRNFCGIPSGPKEVLELSLHR